MVDSIHPSSGRLEHSIMWELGIVWIQPIRMGFRLSLQPDYLNLGDNYYNSGSWKEKSLLGNVSLFTMCFIGVLGEIGQNHYG